jgi:hypothetical protein
LALFSSTHYPRPRSRALSSRAGAACRGFAAGTSDAAEGEHETEGGYVWEYDEDIYVEGSLEELDPIEDAGKWYHMSGVQQVRFCRFSRYRRLTGGSGARMVRRSLYKHNPYC